MGNYNGLFRTLETTFTEIPVSSTEVRAASFQHCPNYSNYPFNLTTIIHYDLTYRSYVTLAGFNTVGQQMVTLVNGEGEEEYHEVTFIAEGLASGVYFYRIQASGYTQTRRLCPIR